MKKIGIIIQARTGSTRLPKKMILPFYKNESVLELLIKKLKQNFTIPILLATTNNSFDNSIESIAKKNKILCFKGDENNVLKRFIDAATQHKIDVAIRVCADNPFLEIDFIKQIIELYNKKEQNYISYSTANNTPAMKTHFGLFAELVEVETLKKVAELTTDILYTEHVTNFIYSNPQLFAINFIKIPAELENKSIRLTLDTEVDFKNLQYIYTELKKKRKKINYKNILTLLNGNSHLLTVMSNEIKKNSK